MTPAAAVQGADLSRAAERTAVGEDGRRRPAGSLPQLHAGRDSPARPARGSPALIAV